MISKEGEDMIFNMLSKHPKFHLRLKLKLSVSHMSPEYLAIVNAQQNSKFSKKKKKRVSTINECNGVQL